MSKIVMCVGLPASGKSTFARNLVDTDPTYKRLNRDELRKMLDNGKWSQSKEKHIKKAELLLAEMFLAQGLNIVVDDCNLAESAQSMWQELARKMQVMLEIQDFTHVPVETCIERDRNRPNSVGEQVIRKMYRDFLQPNPIAPVYIEGLPEAIITDIDGTLALLNGRNPYDASTCEQDEVNRPIAHILRLYRDHGSIILLVSGRSEQYRPQTERWLECNHIDYDFLSMRPEGDKRKDALVKRERYEQHIQGRYNILFVLDDRNQMVSMWRDEIGLTCLQVADGDF